MKMPLDTDRPGVEGEQVVVEPTVCPAAEEVVDHEEEAEGGEVVGAGRVVQQRADRLLGGLHNNSVLADRPQYSSVPGTISPR